jgi:hypothetical protein
MIFYSGFSLKNESYFFENWLNTSDYTVAGFSYGAIKAAQHVVNTNSRIDTLQLFSPAFFQTQTQAFKKLQLRAFGTSPQEYREKFLTTCFSPYCSCAVELNHEHNSEDLSTLLHFVWDKVLMQKIINKGVRIEVFLGLEDKVVDAISAQDFFLPFATVTSIRTGNHFLQMSSECSPVN